MPPRLRRPTGISSSTALVLTGACALFVAVQSAPAITVQIPPPVDSVHVSIRSAIVAPGAAFALPISVTSLDEHGVTAYQLTVRYDPASMTVEDVIRKGTLSERAIVYASHTAQGELRIAAAATEPITGEGALIILAFAAGPEPAESPVTITEFLLNEGTPSASWSDGYILVSGH